MRRAQGKVWVGLGLAVGLLGFSACFFLPRSEDSGGDETWEQNGFQFSP